MTSRDQGLGCWSLLVAYLATILLTNPVTTELLEACAWDTLEAECPPHHAILIDQARYGRMHLGKCIKQNFGFIGCSADVRQHIDPICSGRSGCSLDVYNTLQNHRPSECKELEAFLQIEFRCVPVVPLPRQKCAERMVSIHEQSGYLPSTHPPGETVVTGRQGCTVELVAQRGQTWNLTLLDFGQSSDKSLTDSKVMGRQEDIWCTRYAIVKESGSSSADSSNKQQVICGNTEGQARERNIYLSNSNIITVDMNLDVQSTYLIVFQVIGCPIPTTPNIVHVKREGDEHTFYCNATGENWSLTCKGSHWQGHHKACGTVPKSSEFRTNRDWNSTTGLVIVVGLGLVLGVIIGSSLLGLVVCYYRRRYKRAPPVQQIYSGPTYGSSQQKDTASLYKTYDPEPGRRLQSSVEYTTKPPNLADTYKYPYQSCRPSVPYIANLPEPMVTSHNPARTVSCGTPARAARVGMDEDLMMSHSGTGPGTHYGRSTSDSSSNSDHVYEIPS